MTKKKVLSAILAIVMLLSTFTGIVFAEETVTITGTLKDAKTLATIAGATVTFSGYGELGSSTTTDSYGVYRLTINSGAQGGIRAYADGYADCEVVAKKFTEDYDYSDVMYKLGDEFEHNCKFKNAYTPSNSVEGTTTVKFVTADKIYTASTEGTSVKINIPGDVEGHFEITNDDYFDYVGDKVKLDPMYRDTDEFALLWKSVSVDVSGVVTDESTGNPIEGASLEFKLKHLGSKFSVKTLTDATGSYSVTVPMNVEKVDLKIEKSGFLTYNKAFETKNDPITKNISLVLNDGNVAKIGNNRFGSLEDAFTAATDNDKIIVLKDCEASGNATISNNITLDLGENVVTAEREFATINGGKLTVENGTVLANGDDDVFKVCGTESPATEYSKLTLNNVTVDAESASSAILIKGGFGSYGLDVEVLSSNIKAKNGIVLDNEVVRDGPEVTSGPKKGANISIKNGSSITAASDGIALVSSGYGIWNVNTGNNVISGGTGIFATDGEFTVNGAQISANGPASEHERDDIKSTGDAVVICASHNNTLKMNLKDDIVSSANGNAIRAEGTEDFPSVDLTVDGGSYTAAEGKQTIYTNDKFNIGAENDAKVFVMNDPVGVCTYLFNDFMIDLGDGIPYRRDPYFDGFDSHNVHNCSDIALNANFTDNEYDILFPYASRDKKPVIHFSNDVGALYYKVFPNPDWVRLSDGDELNISSEYGNENVNFKIACGSEQKDFGLSVEWKEHAGNAVNFSIIPMENTDALREGMNELGVYVASPECIAAAEFAIRFGTEVNPMSDLVSIGEEMKEAYFIPGDGFSLVSEKFDENCLEVALAADADNINTGYGSQFCLGHIRVSVPQSAPCAKIDFVDSDDAENAIHHPRAMAMDKDTFSPTGLAVGVEAWQHSFKYENCENMELTVWLRPGATLSNYAQEPIPCPGYGVVHDDAGIVAEYDRECGWNTDNHELPEAAGNFPQEHIFKAHHIRFANAPTEESSQYIEKIVRINPEEGEKEDPWHYKDDEIIIQVKKDLGEKKVIRKDGVLIKKNEGIPEVIDGDEDGRFFFHGDDSHVEIIVNPSTYVEITFAGNDGASLDRNENLVAYTTADTTETLYASLDDYIKYGDAFDVPKQKANTGYRLDPPQGAKAENKADQVWLGTDGKNYSTGLLNASPADIRFVGDTILTPVTATVHKVTFKAGEGGSIDGGEKSYYVDDSTPMEDILKGTAHDYTKGDEIGSVESLIPVPTPTPDTDSYKFKEWTYDEGELDDGKVVKDMIITAEFELNHFTFDISGKASFKNVQGDITDGNKISAKKDLTFELVPDVDTRIINVEYYVAGTDGAKSISANQAGVYTVPKADITGDLTIAVSTVDTVTIIVKAGANGKVSNQTAFVVDKGTYWSSDIFNGLTLVPDNGYEATGRYYLDYECMECFADGETSLPLLEESVTVYAEFDHKSYSLNLRDDYEDYLRFEYGIDNTSEESIVVTHGTEAVIQLGGDYIASELTFSVDGGVQNITLTPVNVANRQYMIPGQYIIGDVTLNLKTLGDKVREIDDYLADFDVEFVAREDYKANVVETLGKKILVLKPQDAFKESVFNTHSLQLSNGTSLFWSNRYGAFVCWVKDELEASDLDLHIKIVDVETKNIDYNGDINGNNSTDADDAGIVADSLYTRRFVPTTAEQLFRMDVDGKQDEIEVNANDVTWILERALGLQDW